MITISLWRMTNKKILYIATEDTPGMRPYASSVMKAVWDENSWAIIVLRSEKSKLDYASLPHQDKITYIYFPKNKFAKLLYHIYPISVINAIRRIVKENKIDLIHTLTGEITLSYVFASLQRKIRILHTVHDAIGHDYKFSSLWARIKELVFVEYPNKYIITKAENLVSNSLSQVDFLKQKYPLKTISYVPFPTLINDTIRAGKKSLPELKGESGYILFFGGVQLYKGVHLLCDVYKKNRKSFGERKLVIAGAGDYFKMSNDKDIIRIDRYIADEEVRSLFNAAEIVVYPYISATQSGVLSIASYFGRKIVISDVPYFKSIAAGYEGVVMFKSSDTIDMSRAICEMLASKSNTYKLYADVYDTNMMKHSIEAVQNEVLSKK